MKIPTMKSAIWALACVTALPAFAASCDSLAALALPDTTSHYGSGCAGGTTLSSKRGASKAGGHESLRGSP